MRILFKQTDAEATAAGDNSVRIVGVTDTNFIFTSDFGGFQVPLDCQRAVVILRLGSDVILGEQGKQRNHLGTSAKDRSFFLWYGGCSFHKKYIDNPPTTWPGYPDPALFSAPAAFRLPSSSPSPRRTFFLFLYRMVWSRNIQAAWRYRQQNTASSPDQELRRINKKNFDFSFCFESSNLNYLYL